MRKYINSGNNDSCKFNFGNNANILAFYGICSKRGSTKIRNKCFKILWTCKKDNEGIPLVKWKNLDKHKEEEYR